MTGAGEALVRASQVVPSVFFSKNFNLEDPATFHRACPAVEDGERDDTLSTLLSHLDLVRQTLTHMLVLCNHLLLAWPQGM